MLSSLFLKYRYCFLLVAMATSCSPSHEEPLEGLWELESVMIDAMEKPMVPTFIEIKDNSSFALSRTSGDIVGVYKLNDKNVRFVSHDKQLYPHRSTSWFNTEWSVYYHNGHMELRGVAADHKYTKLHWKRIDQIPDFQEFEDNIVGKWELYKIRKNNEVIAQSNLSFYIDANGNYALEDPSGKFHEKGRAVIDTRHKKITFESDQTLWNVWLYGRELRLDNEKLGIQYSLRRESN